jgi:(1->4)-alpha-D-glucan 1-alpha-D-glucosylmutase
LRAVRAALANWTDGAIKLIVAQTLLALRKDMPDLFARGGYDAITIEGARADAVCAFTRSDGPNRILVLVARFPGGVEPGWRDDYAPVAGNWQEVLCGRRFSGEVPLGEALADLPVAVLVQR